MKHLNSYVTQNNTALGTVTGTKSSESSQVQQTKGVRSRLCLHLQV